MAVLKDGHIQQVDTPQRLHERPVNAFVAAFIGSPSMNLFEATLSSGEIQLGSQQLRVPSATFDRCPALANFDGGSVIVGIRPEDLQDASRRPAHVSQGTITASVALTESLGSEVVVHFAVDAQAVDVGDPDAIDDVELATLGWVNWFNTDRIHSYLNNDSPDQRCHQHQPTHSWNPTKQVSAKPRVDH